MMAIGLDGRRVRTDERRPADRPLSIASAFANHEDGNSMTMLRTRALIGSTALLASAALAPAAGAAIFGTEPLAISIDPSAGAPNGPSAHPAVSGDNRQTRYAAFDSTASNLVADDGNGQADVFVWTRPSGGAGIALTNPGDGLRRVSVTASGGEANGASTEPSLDGSTRVAPHCVAFQSTASNLTPDDADATSDVFVRDLRSGRTTLVSRGIAPAATSASIDGSCTRVAFAAGGSIYTAKVSGGRPRRVAAGADPDYALDGSALVWSQGGSVFIARKGRTDQVGPGGNATVGDNDSGKWAVSFDTTASLTSTDDNPGSDVYQRLVHARGGSYDTDLISAARRGANSLGGDSYNGGLTAYAGTRGIIVFVNDTGSASDLYYRNNHSGNIDDLAHAPAGTPIADIATSARANFVAFASRATFVGDTDGQQAVFFKHLIDGEPV
jgi:hypothetical protein